MLSRIADYPIVRDSAGEQTNPTTSTVMADTGHRALFTGGTGFYEVLCAASTTANAQFQLEVRNRANDATVGDAHVFYCPANQTVAVPFRVQLESEQRLRIMMNANLTGDAAATVVAQRVA